MKPLELFYWPTPNGHKIAIFLEEAGLPYSVHPVNIGRGAQFDPEFLAKSPNNKIPALVDPEPEGGGAPISLFESGAILQYLAEKTGKFLPGEVHARFDVLTWLTWQVAHLGPMAGQAGHFRDYAPERITYAIDRYANEVNRLYGVLDRRLEGRDFVAGDASIADFAIYPWVAAHARHGITLSDFPNVERWAAQIAKRPAVVRAYAVGAEVRSQPVDAEARKFLFGQTAASVRSAASKG